MAKINIYNDEWCDILFEDRNQGYGAFVLRKSSGRRHFTAIAVTVSVFLIAVIAPTIIKKVMPKKEAKIVTVATLSDLKIEQQKKDDKKKDIVVKEYKKVAKIIKFTPPVIKPDEEVTDTTTMRTQENLNETKGRLGSEDMDGVVDDPDSYDATKYNQILEDSVQTPYTFVEQMPEFPGGGMDAFLAYLAKNIRYPELARDNGISGTVYIQFVVGTNGKPTDIKVVRGFDESCEREALRVIKNMPAWIPGKQNGMAVRVLLSVPVRFKLE